MIQYSRDASDRTEKPRRTGFPACAGMTTFHLSRNGDDSSNYFFFLAFGSGFSACGSKPM
jgi:hypothetical protein